MPRCNHLDPATRWLPRERVPRVNDFVFTDVACAACGILLAEPRDHRRGKLPFAFSVAPCCDGAKGRMVVDLSVDGTVQAVWLGRAHNHAAAPSLRVADIKFCPLCGTRTRIVEADVHQLDATGI